MQKGYVIQSIHEVWHFEKSTVSLFKDNVNTWLKLKVEASGWPHENMTQDEKQQYIQAFKTIEGIELDPENIAYNPGMRALAKFTLNSMWGKFGQRLNRREVKEFTDPQDFSEFLESDKYNVRYISVLSEHRVEIHHRTQTEDIPIAPNLKFFLAAFTTCWARLYDSTNLRLYDAIDVLQDHVLYYDTDSVIFIQSPHQQPLQLGDYLGDFTSELEARDHIVEFCSAGPKTYGYQTANGKVCCKVKGFSLNSEGSAQLNYNVTRSNLLDELRDPLQQPQSIPVKQSHAIQRDVKTYSLFTRPITKLYQLVYSKRALDSSTYITYLFGFEN